MPATITHPQRRALTNLRFNRGWGFNSRNRRSAVARLHKLIDEACRDLKTEDLNHIAFMAATHLDVNNPKRPKSLKHTDALEDAENREWVRAGKPRKP